MSDVSSASPQDLAKSLKASSGVMRTVGVIQIVLGAAAILAPQVATAVGVEFLAWMLCFSSVMQGVLAFRTSGWKGASLLGLGALISLAAGLLILMDPLEGAIAITLFLAIACGFEGVTRLMIGMSSAGAHARGALVLCGLASLAVGALLALEWPGDSVWAIGLLLGVNLFMTGFSVIGVASAASRGDAQQSS
ncbi:MAG: DUF308 domain-containing protein [Planctomycetota bacterium]|jgi:uncharacterized membrane protein HdeD (DUF308 family)|nr:DUF308 domain-containing protein [Planctomycetota bacterium]